VLRAPETDVLVVGAGPVGLFHALSLVERGASVRVVDEQWRAAAHSYALLLHPRTLELLDELDLVESVIDEGRPIETIGFYEGHARHAELRLSEVHRKYPFAVVLPQSRFEALLEERLRQLGTLVRWNEELLRLRIDGEGVVAEIGRLEPSRSRFDESMPGWSVGSTYEARPRFVIAADGIHSRIRQVLDIGYEVMGPPEMYGVFEFECDHDLGSEARVVLGDGMKSVLWPLPDGRCRWSFQLPDVVELPAPRAKARLAACAAKTAFPYLNEKLLGDLIEERAPWFDSRRGEVFWSTAVRFERRLVTRFGRGPIRLAGDAAHQTGPVGVQSMNAAMREGRDLSEKIRQILREGSSLDVLDTHEHKYREEWRRLLGEGGPARAMPAWAAERRARILPCIPASGADLDLLLSQIGLPALSRS
jgi:2-polyprenyl-6-methoxyphenol hydroxylase-like FAD-dependent oxidoreductase